MPWSCTRPALEADPATDGTRTRHVHRAPSDAARGADRRHRLRRRDQEVDLHADERPAPARGRLPDALLRERRRRGRRRDLLRPLGHRQDHALGRPRAAPDRRRRARLGRHGRLQLRGRLLREGDPPLGRGRAGDLRDDAAVRDAARERRRRRATGSLDLASEEKTENTRGAYRLERSRTRCRRSAAGIRERRLPHRRRLRRDAADRAAHRARRPPTTSSPASPPSSPAPRSASPSRARPSRRASAGRSCRSRRRSTRGSCTRSSSRTARRCGS